MKGIGRVFWPRMPAERLAMLRILIGLYGVIYLLTRVGAILGVARYKASQFRPVGAAAWLDAPLPAWTLGAGLVLAIGLGIAFVLGWRFRWTGPAYAAALLWVTSYRNSWGMVFHTENLLVLHTVVLGLSASADTWRWPFGGQPKCQASSRYGWAVVLMGLLTTLTYFVAGWAKLSHSGIEWVTSDTLRNFVAYDNVRKIELGSGYSVLGAWMVAHPSWFHPLAAFSLVVELGAPLAILHRRLGMVWAAAAWGFHVGVLAMMFILFHYPMIGVAYASFFPVEKLGRWVWGRVRRKTTSGRPDESSDAV